jgi:sortase A
VRDTDSPEALHQGAIKLPSTGFPWQEGANTYIAAHRIGYPGTESHNQFFDLPAMQEGDAVFLTDANGTEYEYRVTEIFAVSPSDTWVTEPIPGRDMVTLQTCTHTVDDWWSITPQLMEAGPETGRLVVRADRV